MYRNTLYNFLISSAESPVALIISGTLMPISLRLKAILREVRAIPFSVPKVMPSYAFLPAQRNALFLGSSQSILVIS